MPDGNLADRDDDEACSSQRLEAVLIVTFERRQLVESLRLHLDEHLAITVTHREVDTADPAHTADFHLTAHPQSDGPQQLLQAGLEPTRRCGVGRPAFIDDRPERRDSTATPLGELDDHSCERPCGDEAVAEHPVDQSLESVREHRCGDVGDRS